MIEINQWENGNGYNVALNRIEALTLMDALRIALRTPNGKGNFVGNYFEIDVKIKGDFNDS